MIIILVIVLTFLTSSPILAALPTPTLTPTPTTTDDIQKIRQAVQQKVLEKLRQITTDDQTDQPKSFFGTVVTLIDSQITLDHNGTTRQLTIDPEAVYIDIKRNKAKVSSIKVGQGLLALGRLDSNQSLLAKRLVAVDLESTKPKDQLVFGQITDISQSSPVFTLTPLNNKDQQFQIKTTSKSEIVTPKKTKLTTTDLAKGHRLIAVIQPATGSTYTAITLVDLDFSTITPSPTPKP